MITIQTSIAETDLTGKTIVCDNLDERGYKGFINKRFIYGFIDSKQVVKFEYGYHYKTDPYGSVREYLLGGVVTQKIGTYKDYSPNPNNLIFEFDKNVKTISYKNKYEKAEAVLQCKGMSGWDADDKNHCATEILHRQELKLHKNVDSRQHGKLDIYAQPQWRARCVLGADDGFASLVEVVQENWMNEIKKGREDAQRKIQENKSKNQL